MPPRRCGVLSLGLDGGSMDTDDTRDAKMPSRALVPLLGVFDANVLGLGVSLCQAVMHDER